MSVIASSKITDLRFWFVADLFGFLLVLFGVLSYIGVFGDKQIFVFVVGVILVVVSTFFIFLASREVRKDYASLMVLAEKREILDSVDDSDDYILDISDAPADPASMPEDSLLDFSQGA